MSEARTVQHFHDGRPCYVTDHSTPQSVAPAHQDSNDSNVRALEQGSSSEQPQAVPLDDVEVVRRALETSGGVCYCNYPDTEHDRDDCAIRNFDSLVERLKRAEEQRDDWQQLNQRIATEAESRIADLLAALEEIADRADDMRSWPPTGHMDDPVAAALDLRNTIVRLGGEVAAIARNALPPTSPTGEEGS